MSRLTEYLENRMIPGEYLDVPITVNWWAYTGIVFPCDLLYPDGKESKLLGDCQTEMRMTGVLEFSGEYHIKLKYYRRNKQTKRAKAYYQTIYKQDLISWEWNGETHAKR